MRRLVIRKAPHPDEFGAVVALQKAIMHNLGKGDRAKAILQEALAHPTVRSLMRRGILKMQKPRRSR